MSPVIHAPGKALDNGCVLPLCGRWTKDAVNCIDCPPSRPSVTCKRCLASLAKADRAFRAKARGWFRPAPGTELHIFRGIDNGRAAAARAIAAEEGSL